jgi:hypothetical protein
MQIHPIIFQFDLVFAMSFKLGYNWVPDFCQKSQFRSSVHLEAFSVYSRQVASFFLILKEKDNFRGNQKIV